MEVVSMAQQSNIVDDEMNTKESATSSSAIVKESFSAWLADGHATKYSPWVYLTCIDMVSDYLINRKITSVGLWHFTNFNQFKSIYNRVIKDRLFKATEKKAYAKFVQVGMAFLKFLKSKPTIHKVPAVAFEPPIQSGSNLTIKEAIIRVLEYEPQGMTAEQIYRKIIADGLYSFGAQNPQNVVRVEIDRACENSNYTVRASKNCFRLERNQKGEKVYFLLSVISANDTDQPRFVVNGEPSEPGEVKNEPLNIEIWNDSIERNFQIWMESENYAAATARNYCSAVNRTVQNFKPLVDAAVSESLTTSEAVRIFVALLHQDSGFIAANSTAHNQFSAALAALTGFVGKDTSVFMGTADSEVKSITSTLIDESVKSAVVSMLEERFPNGIRPNSVIDINKLKCYCREAKGEEIISKNIDIPSLLNSIGIRHGEKVFAIPKSGKKELSELLYRVIAEDNCMFYYDEFYEAHADFLQEIHIFSSELLKMVLFDVLPSLHYSRNSFSTEINATVESEVLRCYETAVCLSYEQLKSKLPYVSLDKVKQVLAQNSNFVWVGTGVYTHTSKLEVDFNEWRTVEKRIEAEISERGYASLASLDVSASLELNPELSETAVKNGLFQVRLADRYEKRGNIMMPKGSALNSVAVFEDYCLTHDRLTLDELFDFEKETNGGRSET